MKGREISMIYDYRKHKNNLKTKINNKKKTHTVRELLFVMYIKL